MLRTATRIIFVLLLAALVLSCELFAASRIENAVTTALKKDPRTASYSFEAALREDGAVAITGEVDMDSDLAVVAEIASKVPGVKSVINNCHVREESSGMLQDDVVPMF
jgi:GTP-sensing pleiotropic transcriptional regulator CodY